VALNDDQLAGILQATIDFATQILEKMAVFTPFGGRVKADGELEFFSPAPDAPEVSFQQLYGRVEAQLIDDARRDGILAAVIAVDVTVPPAIDTPFRNAIGVFIETPDFCRFVYATYRLPKEPVVGEKVVIERGEMIPIEGKPAIFAA